MSNGLAYCDTLSVMSVKCFKMQATDVNVIKLFYLLNLVEKALNLGESEQKCQMF